MFRDLFLLLLNRRLFSEMFFSSVFRLLELMTKTVKLHPSLPVFVLL